MKKFLSILMASLILLTPTYTFAEVERPNANNNNTELTEQEEPREIRNQDILVPTKDGVQRATYEEAVKIDKYDKMPLESLTGSYLLADYDSGVILEGYNIDEVHAMASTSKLVSLFVVMDKIKEGALDLEDVVTIDKESASLSGSSYKLKEGDRVKVKNLLRAAVVISGNDAITALGKEVAGTTENFVKMMNEKCKELGLENAHMVNPTGLTDYSIEDYNKMTTKEMFILSKEIIKAHPEILEMSKEKSLTKANGEDKEYNTNPLLGVVKGVDGLKTGYTNAAGRCLIATAEKKSEKEGEKPMRLIAITTGSAGNWQRYSASKRLMESGLENYSKMVVGDSKKPVTTINIEGCSREESKVFVKKPSTILVDKRQNLDTSISIYEGLKAPIEPGESIGSISYFLNGEEVYKSDLVLKDKANQKGFIFKIQNICQDIFNNIRKVA